MTKTVLLSSCATVLAAACLVAPSLAAAQQAASPPASTETSSSVEEVVVTADRRVENLQTVPITAEVTTGSQLSQLGVTDTQELSDFIPGLNVSRANVGAVPYLRGVGAITATVGNEAAIATYIDDVYRPAAGASNYAFNDVSRVEVLNGPQGTLFGRNAAGGVINVITRDPTETPVLDAEVGYGNYATVTSSVYVGGPIAQNLVADFSAYYENQADGWGTNFYNGSKAYTSKAASFHNKWIWTPTPDDKVTLVTYYDREYNQEGAASNVIPGTINAAGYGAAPGFYNVNTNFDGYDDTIDYGVDLKYQHDFGKFNLTSITSGQEADWRSIIENDSSPANFQEARVDAHETTYQEELRIASDASSKIQWIGGLYGFLDRSNPDPFTQYGTGLHRPQNVQYTYSVQDTTSYAVFGQVTLPILDANHLVLGARYSEDYRHIDGATYYYPTATATAPTSIANADSAGTYSGAPTFRVSFDHEFSSDFMAYASWNRGFKSGNYNTNTPTAPPTLPETLDAFEVGAKTEFFDDKVQVDTSAFYYLMHNLQVQQQLSTGTLQTNAGAARYRGVDLAVVAKPINNFSITWSAEYLDAKYTEYNNAQFNTPNPAGGYTSYVANAAGYDLPYADPFTSSLSARYVIDEPVGQIALFSEAAYHSGFHFDTQGLVRQPRYGVLNASITFITISKRWDVSLWGDNLTNAHYYSQEQISATGETYSPAAPLTFGVKFRVHL
jgi:iron complex outermembrane receptor protein